MRAVVLLVCVHVNGALSCMRVCIYACASFPRGKTFFVCFSFCAEAETERGNEMFNRRYSLLCRCDRLREKRLHLLDAFAAAGRRRRGTTVGTPKKFGFLDYLLATLSCFVLERKHFQVLTLKSFMDWKYIIIVKHLHVGEIKTVLEAHVKSIG